MLYTYHSNKIELLKELVLQIMSIDPLKQVFEKECFLVQSPGMTKWLMQEISNKKGICANMDFPLASSFIWDVFNKFLPDTPQRSAFSKDSMQWTLAKILPDLIDNPDYRPLKNYLGLGDITESKIHQLSNRIADVFDGYQVYRPDWILSWETGDIDEEIVKGQEWQPKLWKELYDHIISSGRPHHHRANMYAEFLKSIGEFANGNKPLPDGFPTRIFMFGVSSLPPHHLKVIEALATVVDIHFMFFNPCHMFWGDIKDKKVANRQLLKQYQAKLIQGDFAEKYGNSLFEENVEVSIDETLSDAIGNGLLSSMGKLGRDTLSLLSQIEGQQEISAFVEPEGDSSLLENIKADVFNLSERGEDSKYEDSLHKSEISTSDNSIKINSCHSEMREIEVLQNEILAMMEGDKSLTPRDFIIMCSDIDRYSPYIEAVFGNVGRFDNRYIPYSISDKSAEHEHPIVASFMRLVDVNNSRYSSTDVMEILKTKAIQARFGIDDDEYSDLHDVVKGVGIRWGLDKETSKNLDLPALDVNTWAFGIKRLLLGYTMPMDAGFFSETLPFDLPMNVSYETIGKLSRFIEKLKDWHEQFTGSHSADSWSGMISNLANDFFVPQDPADFSAIELITKTTQRLHSTLNEVEYDKDLPLSIISDEIIQRLRKEQISQRFLAGKLNFCTLMPMRSIPFKVVCLVGMNDGKYPRNTPIANYDLTGVHPQIGDRSRRNDDRYMFLEAILSAEEKLMISYVGKSSQDGSHKNSSTLVQELLDYCSSGYCLEDDQELNVDESAERLLNHLHNETAMTPYSEADFVNGCGSFSREWAQSLNSNEVWSEFCSVPLDIGEKDLDDGENYRLNLSELMKFWKLPAKHLFSRRLKSSLSIEDDSLQEDEPFNLDNLESYKIRKKWLSEILALEAVDTDTCDNIHSELLKEQKGSGVTPINAFGEVLINNERAKVEELSLKVMAAKGGEDHPVDIDILITLKNDDKIKVQGTVRDVYEVGAVCFRVGKVRPADIFDAWIRQLVLCASGLSKDVLLLGHEGNKIIHPIAQEEAIQLLTILVEWYYIGLTKPLPFIVDVAYEGIKTYRSRSGLFDSSIEDEFPSEKSEKKMRQVYERSYLENNLISEPHVLRIWPEWSDSLAQGLHEMGKLVLFHCFVQTESLKE